MAERGGSLAHFPALLRALQTVRYLKPRQIWYQMLHRLMPRRFVQDCLDPCEVRQIAIRRPIKRPCRYLGQGRFVFLNQSADLGQPVNWQAAHLPRLWQYNLHYFDYLLQPDMEKQSGLCLIRDWISHHSPACGMVGWEPYPISLRTVNWLKFMSLQTEYPPDVVQSLTLQGQNLERQIEYHLLGNHLFANGKALWWLGAFLNRAEWSRKGQEIIKSELREQFLPDGGHFELSPMYHSILLEDLLDLLNLSSVSEAVPFCDRGERRRGDFGSRTSNLEQRTSNIDPDSDPPLHPHRGERDGERWGPSGLHLLATVASKALAWLEAIVDDSGRIPLLNDSAYGVAPTPTDLRAYADHLGVTPDACAMPTQSVGNWSAQNLSGYWVLRNGPFRVIFDTAPLGPDYLPGHAHCDLLSVLVDCEGKPVFTDTGVFEYEEGLYRTYCRSVAAHNTVSIDHLDQAEMWKSFRVGRRGYPIGFEISGNQIRCGHNGFHRQRQGILHYRSLRLNEDGFEIIDDLAGPDDHQFEAFYHIAPGVTFCESAGEGFIFNDSLLVIPRGVSFELRTTPYYPEFGHKLERRCLVLRGSFTGKTQFGLKCKSA